MVGIQAVANGAQAAAARGPRRAGGGGFRVPQDDATERTAEATAAGGAVPVGAGLLALQERGGEAERDAAARRRGEALLDELRALQGALLRGAADPACLERMAALAEGPAAADPGLRSAMAAITLRARVELARIRLHPDASRK